MKIHKLNKSIFIFLLLLILLITGNTYIFTQTQNHSLSIRQPIVLKGADSLIGSMNVLNNVKKFMGHVRFMQGNVNSISDFATQFIDENRAELLGNVLITQEDMKLKAPLVNYNGNTMIADAPNGIVITDKLSRMSANHGVYSTSTKIAEFTGKVDILDDSTRIKADSLIYNRNNRYSYAYGNVKIEDDSSVIYANSVEHHRFSHESFAYGKVTVYGKYNNIILMGDTLLDSPDFYFAECKGNPVLFRIDTIEKKAGLMPDTLFGKHPENWMPDYYAKLDTMCISSERMESNRLKYEETYFFNGKVEIVKGNVAAVSDRAIFFKYLDIIELTGKPVVWQGTTQLHADSVIVNLQNGKLTSIVGYKKAVAVSRAEDSVLPDRINQISGERIELHFDKDTIRFLSSSGNAKSLYYIVSDDKSGDGAARNGSDTIIVEFENGEAAYINWLGSIQGEFFPENVVSSSPIDALPTFRWSDNKPVKKKLPGFNK